MNFEQFNKLTVLVVGDVMIDRYLSGKVDRISPEAPVPVVHLQQEDNRLGGAANVALNLSAMGAYPILCSVVGQDNNGKLFREKLAEQGLTSRGMIQSVKRKTTVKTRVLAANQQLIRVDQEDTHDLDADEEKKLLRRIREILDNREIDLIIFQDYNKGVLSHSVIRELILESVKRDILTAVDPKKKNFWAYRHVSLFKPNLKEIRESLPFPIRADVADLKKASAYIRQKLGNTLTLITLSEKGLFMDSGDRQWLEGTRERAIADVCGAGDTVICVASLALAAGMDMETISRLANMAGGQVCERVGVVPVDRKELEKEFLTFHPPA
jgi:rfaE bifunctional protein kinase chain/domain